MQAKTSIAAFLLIVLMLIASSTLFVVKETERAVMDAVNNIGKEITIILIAHRLGSVKNCDKIFLLEKGKIIDQGSFQELINSNTNFKKNANN